MGIEEEVLRRIVPSPETTASIEERASRLKATVEEYIASHGIDVEARFAGSFSKGTFLSDPDLDLFLMFPVDVPKEKVKEIGLKAGEDILHGMRMYSDHPYTRGSFEGLDVDMVPCYHIDSTEHMLSAVDRTPFHTQFIKSHLSEKGKDQVRLLKKFMKGIGAYGAEQDSRGFSGYLCELLIVRFGAFSELMKAASRWKAGTVIEIQGKGPAMTAPLVVYDPVDSKRNVASAVHLDTLSLFIVAAKAYCAEPSMRFFFPDARIPDSREKLAERAELHGSRLVSVVFGRPEAIEDNLYSQLWKTQAALEKKLNEFSFNVLRAAHGMDDSKMTVVFEVERDTVSRTFKHRGPPVSVMSEPFTDKWRGSPYGDPFIEDGAWMVIAERQYADAREMLRDEACRAGIGRELDSSGMEVLGHEMTISSVDPLLLTELLDPRLPWEPAVQGRRGPVPGRATAHFL